MATVRKRVRTAANGEEKTVRVADYFDQHRTRHLKTFATKKAAQAWLVETQGEIARGVHTPERASINVDEAARLWLERCAAEGVERGTMRGYQALVRLHIGPSSIGATKPALLTTPTIKKARNKLVSGHSRILARKIRGTLKSVLSEAQRRGLVAQNAALPVRVATKKREIKKLEVGPTSWAKPISRS